MKKRWMAAGAIALVLAGGYALFEAQKYRLPGLIQDWRDPVQDNRPVIWAPGPAAAPAGVRPPNIILIVADEATLATVLRRGLRLLRRRYQLARWAHRVDHRATAALYGLYPYNP